MALEVEVCDVVESISKAWNDEPTVPSDVDGKKASKWRWIHMELVPYSRYACLTAVELKSTTTDVCSCPSPVHEDLHLNQNAPLNKKKKRTTETRG
jgi:hypothetical protein